MENFKLPDIVVMRWNEAVAIKNAQDSIRAWRSLSDFAAINSEIIRRISPDDITASALHGVSEEAYKRYIQLQKVNEHADAT